MHNRIRLVLLATITAACLGALTSLASAARLSISNQHFRVTHRSLEIVADRWLSNPPYCPSSGE
jgi:hypothetical protein